MGYPNPPSQPPWPHQGGQPGHPAHPAHPGQPGHPAHPGQPAQPGYPAQPGQPFPPPGQPGQPYPPGAGAQGAPPNPYGYPTDPASAPGQWQPGQGAPYGSPPPSGRSSGKTVGLIVGLVAGFFLLLDIGGGVLLWANNSVGGRSPEKTVEEYLAAFAKGNCGKMFDLVTEETWRSGGATNKAEAIAECEESLDALNMGITIDVESTRLVSESGDTAVVEATTTVTLDEWPEPVTSTSDYTLRKSGGDWLLDGGADLPSTGDSAPDFDDFDLDDFNLDDFEVPELPELDDFEFPDLSDFE